MGSAAARGRWRPIGFTATAWAGWRLIRACGDEAAREAVLAAFAGDGAGAGFACAQL
jgi:hypothetical protein